jgi:hypothetical protein
MHVYEATVHPEDVGFDDREWETVRWCTEDELKSLASRDDVLCPDTAASIRKYFDLEPAFSSVDAND